MADLSYMWAGKPVDPVNIYLEPVGFSAFNLVVGEAAIVVMSSNVARTPTITDGDLVFAGSNPAQTVHFFYTKYANQTSQIINHGVAGASGSYQIFRINPFGLPPGAVAASEIGVNVTGIGADFSSPAITPAQNNATIFCVSGMNNLSGWPSDPPAGYQWVVRPASGANMFVSATKQDAAASTTAVIGMGYPNMQIAFYPVNGTLPKKLLPALNVSDGGNPGTSIVKWNRTAGVWVQGTVSDPADQLSRITNTITPSVADGDTGIGLAAGAGNWTMTLPLENLTADFVSMTSLAVRYSSDQFGPYVDDSGHLRMRIFKSDGTTLLANSQANTGFYSYLEYFNGSNWTGQGGTAPGYNKALNFVWIDTAATAADWNGALAELNFDTSVAMGNDGAAIILVDFKLIGTYVSNSSAGSLNQTDTRDTLSGIGAATETGLSTTKPANVRAFPVSGTQVDMTWDPVLGATGYDIRRDGTIIANNVQALAYSDTAAIADTLYGYYVRAILGPV